MAEKEVVGVEALKQFSTMEEMEEFAPNDEEKVNLVIRLNLQ